ncbi:MAG: SDR family oxidoreductase [Chloroflexi bacterium]|nr:SDR family oxidoreductase [Chloroflexota bacterium]
MPEHNTPDWALILGASSGFGEACSLALAAAGFNIFGVHLDRQGTLPNVQRIKGEIEAAGRKAVFFNINAADAEKRAVALNEMEKVITEEGQNAQIRVVLHSLAFGSLQDFIATDKKQELTQKQIEMTVDVMANSLVYWVQDVARRNLIREGGRIFAMTSSGSHRVIPKYGAVGGAKALLEAHIRQLAAELAPRGITANALRGGVTNTPALQKIPGNDKLLEHALSLNPSKRLTVPQDVAAALVALTAPGTYWITGNVINVDGGEDIMAG